MALTKKELYKWKDKYKMLQQYKKEEDFNFKKKFELLVDSEESRFKFKENII